jgi:hypothetical protein
MWSTKKQKCRRLHSADPHHHCERETETETDIGPLPKEQAEEEGGPGRGQGRLQCSQRAALSHLLGEKSEQDSHLPHLHDPFCCLPTTPLHDSLCCLLPPHSSNQRQQHCKLESLNR